MLKLSTEFTSLGKPTIPIVLHKNFGWNHLPYMRKGVLHIQRGRYKEPSGRYVTRHCEVKSLGKYCVVVFVKKHFLYNFVIFARTSKGWREVKESHPLVQKYLLEHAAFEQMRASG